MSRIEFFDFVRRYGAQEERNDRVLTDELAYEILSVVAEIPRGRVATYGQIARLIGRERNARLVGILRRLPLPSRRESCGETGSRLAGAGGTPAR